MKNQTTLYELNEYLKRVIALNFQEPIWISCEISQISEVRGQVYMDVIQQDENTDTVIAQASAVIWYKSYLFLKNKLKDLLPSILTAGSTVLIKVNVEFSERYGMKLVIEDIDPSYTIGHMEMNRRKIINKLEEEGVINLNNELDPPLVIQRVAIISSDTAAGYKDFIAQIKGNEYGYTYSTQLFKAAMQGQNTEREVCAALDDIAGRADEFDCIVIIRGGGSRMDLSWFDSYNIGYKISMMSLPVFTGIGHEIDQSVADIVSHTSFKTPTAVATYLVDHNLHFESSLLQMAQWVGQMAKEKVLSHHAVLDQVHLFIQTLPKNIIEKERNNVTQLQQSLKQTAAFIKRDIRSTLENMSKIVSLLDPKTTLKRGYAIIKEGETIRTSSKELKPDTEITILHADGLKKAIIKK